MTDSSVPLIALVGRPNAGKSTLFNRLTRSQKALVDAQPGVTRDRNFAEARHGERRFMVIDTGGLDLEAETAIAGHIREQTDIAIEESDVVLLLLDGRAGLTGADRDVVERLRRSQKPFWVAVNKLDTPRLDDDAADFFALGTDRVRPISAAHGRGIEDLLDEVLADVKPASDAAPVSGDVAVAIVGRPNVGKSSLVNRLLGYDRSIVTPVAGTTRDAIDTPLRRGNRSYVLVDTAGIRRRPRVHQALERGSVVRALRALERADVAVLLIEATEGMTEQDARLGGHAWEKGKGVVLAISKCDLIDKRAQTKLTEELRHAYPFLEPSPIVFTSARTGIGSAALFPAIDRVSASNRRELPTVQLNQVLRQATQLTAARAVKGKRPNFKYAVQTGISPPTITFFCSHPDLVADSYTRFLVNRLRDRFDLIGTPVRLAYRHGSMHKPNHGGAKPHPSGAKPTRGSGKPKRGGAKPRRESSKPKRSGARRAKR